MNKRQWKKLRKELPRIGIAAWLPNYNNSNFLGMLTWLDFLPK